MRRFSAATVLHQQSQTQAGQLTLVRTAELGTCIRYWFPGENHEQGQVRLQPVPQAQAATTVAQAEILGVIVGVVRMIQPLVAQTDS
ncbi:MAG: hypothetical protein R3C56_02625 [Pirellulaceae bacterium]